MPLIKREVEPTELSRGAISQGIRNELECVTNNTLANVVRQLSSLSKHAEDMFGELFREANSFFHRANRLQERVERLKVKVTQLDSTVEEVSLQDINMRKPFKSSVIKDQQAITITTRPQAIKDTYRNCDAPPPLDKLNPYREDGKDSMKFYTDPTYFFELWCHEMQKDTEMQKKELKKRKKGRPKTGNQRGPTKVREIQTRHTEYQQMAMGKEFIPERKHRDSANYSDGQTPSRPSSLELNQQFMTQQGYAGQNYTGQIPNQGYPGPGHPQGQYAHTNGPVPATGGGNVPNNYQAHQQQMTEQQRYQYNHNHNVDITMQAGHYDVRNLAGRQGSPAPAHSPSKQRMSSSKSNEKISSPRPSQPPPAPPGMQRDSPLGGPGSASRENLPPPPPPPPNDAGGHPVARGASPYGSPGQPLHMNHMNHHHPGVRDSPIRTQSHSPSPQHHTKSSTPDSIDLPPPPPPPPIGQTPDTPGSMSSMPPPPPTPPPPDMYHAHAGHAAPGAPAPPPPPPPPSGGGGGGGRMPNGNIPGGHLAAHHQPDAASLASSASTKSDPEPKAPEPVKDERSDLLAAIRQGIQLRKVEEKRVKEEKKKHSVSGLDVQSIMEAAFEMRRKALEANEDEDEDPDSDVAWDSDEAEC